MKRRLLRRFIAYLHATGAMTTDFSPDAADEVVDQFIRCERKSLPS